MPRAVPTPPGNSSPELPLDPIVIKKAALIIRAVNHPVRQKLLWTIHQDQKMRVTELHRNLKLVQPLVSQHIAALKAAGFLEEERQGRNILYSVNYDRLREIQDLAGKLVRPG
ncbi:MAG TPA: metalloregulator ArsR/SmtB family transcription factor [Chitinophagaceae bacterium]